jgi:diguanylate cyclase (GGDEF)-like protein
MTNALIVEDNFEYAQMLRTVLAGSQHYNLTHVARLNDSLTALKQDRFDIILLDLGLPDSEGLDTFNQIYDAAPEVPIVVISAQNDKEIALRAVRDGAQDYLVKGELSVYSLSRALQYAMERHHTLIHLRQLSFVDDLTGLMNRRGFIALAQQHVKIAQRANREMLLFFIDLDGLKRINDRFGHRAGDQALKKVAEILVQTFRSSDLIARLGGDEYTVLAVDASKDQVKAIQARLLENFRRQNLENKAYPLSVSIGAARYDPRCPLSLDELLEQADQALYIVKRNKN